MSISRDEKGCINNIMRFSGLFKSKNLSHEMEEKKLSPYVINTNIVTKEKLPQRELLIRANPLYGIKTIQKGSYQTCFYYALNYIRFRYKQSGQSFSEERDIEKAFGRCRRESTNAHLCSVWFNRLLDYWTKKNKIDRQLAMTTQEWIVFFELQVENPQMIMDDDLSKEKNNYFLFETYKHIFMFIEYLKVEKSASYTVEQMKQRINLYFRNVSMLIRKDVLIKDLKLDFSTLLIQYLEQRGVDHYSKKINEFIRELDSIGLDAITEDVFFEQETKLNGLHFFGKDLIDNLSTLLDVIEKNGPLVTIVSSNILNPTKTTLIKSVANYPISELEFGDNKSPGISHAMVVVGGGIDALSKQYVYLMDPNDKYTDQAKAPVYRVAFEKFKRILSSYDSGIEMVIDDKPYTLDRNYFIYSKNGLNLTRDPMLKNKTEEESKHSFGR